MFIGTLVSSLIWNLSTGKDTIIAGEETIKADEDF